MYLLFNRTEMSATFSVQGVILHIFPAYLRLLPDYSTRGHTRWLGLEKTRRRYRPRSGEIIQISHQLQAYLSMCGGEDPNFLYKPFLPPLTLHPSIFWRYTAPCWSPTYCSLLMLSINPLNVVVTSLRTFWIWRHLSSRDSSDKTCLLSGASDWKPDLMLMCCLEPFCGLFSEDVANMLQTKAWCSPDKHTGQ